MKVWIVIRDFHGMEYVSRVFKTEELAKTYVKDTEKGFFDRINSHRIEEWEVLE